MLALIALRTYWLLFGGSGIRSDSGICGSGYWRISSGTLVALDLALIASIGLTGSDSGIFVALLTIIWRLSKKIFALVVRLSSVFQLAPRLLAALAFQLGSSVLGGFSGISPGKESLERNFTLEYLISVGGSGSVISALTLALSSGGCTCGPQELSQGTEVAQTFFSRHNHSLFAHGTFSAHGGQPVMALLTCEQGGQPEGFIDSSQAVNHRTY
ncbi:hypothetical protein CJU90_6275 [Yarrowia sp. C11]|nr:hypothetical protein CJU90_6275 [Yarrowia sp. C11]